MWIQKHITSDEKMYRPSPLPFSILRIHCVYPTPFESSVFFIRVICFIPRQMPGRPYFRAISQTLKVYIFIFTSDAYLAGCFSYFFKGFFLYVYFIFSLGAQSFNLRRNIERFLWGTVILVSPPPLVFWTPPCSYSRQ